MTINGGVLYIFTMQPKVGFVTHLNAKRLAKHGTLTHFFSQKPRPQMSPPGLPSTRIIRFSVDVAIRFTPTATGLEIYTPQGHILWPTDLFLLCGRIPDAEKAACGFDDP